jgi:Na+-transporting NADH:ubiquinone oxidoreductase subunit B
MFAILMGNTFAPIIDYFVKEAENKKKNKVVTA